MRQIIQVLPPQDGCVTIGEQPVKKNAKAGSGDVIAVDVPEPKEVSIEPENIPLDIVYEDEDIIVVNKPKGMVVHPAPGNWSGVSLSMRWTMPGRISPLMPDRLSWQWYMMPFTSVSR